MLIYSLPIFDTLSTEEGASRAQRRCEQSAERVWAERREGVGRAQRRVWAEHREGASSKGKQPFCDLKTTPPVSPLVLRRLEDEGRMRRDVARADSPVECAVGVEV